jgi:CHAT domain
MRARDRLDEHHRRLSDAWKGHSRKAAGLEQQLASLDRREDRLPVLRDLRFVESEMSRLGRELARLELEMGDERAPLRNGWGELLEPVGGSPEPFVLPVPANGEESDTRRIDLEIRVRLEERKGKTALLYTLSSPIDHLSSLHEKEIPGPILEGSPERFRMGLIRSLEALYERRGPEREQILLEEIEEELSRLGQGLYLQLFTEGMRRAYLEYRAEVRTVRITSDEPWIPWELVRPFEAKGFDGQPVNDDFLCARFQLTRWLAASNPPVQRVLVRRLACIEAGTVSGLPPLTHARDELEILRRLAASHPDVVDASLPGASYGEVRELLEAGGLQLLHVVGHGDFEAERVEEAKIALCDGRAWRANQLVGPLAASLASGRPFVVFNACRVGQQGWALTGLGGWAEAWIRNAGAGGFLAPQWAVPDSLAWRFAETFYDALSQGHTFGSAVTQARLRIKALNSASPAWLAYALYAHPGGRVVWPEITEA